MTRPSGLQNDSAWGGIQLPNGVGVQFEVTIWYDQPTLPDGSPDPLKQRLASLGVEIYDVDGQPLGNADCVIALSAEFWQMIDLAVDEDNAQGAWREKKPDA